MLRFILTECIANSGPERNSWRAVDARGSLPTCQGDSFNCTLAHSIHHYHFPFIFPLLVFVFISLSYFEWKLYSCALYHSTFKGGQFQLYPSILQLSLFPFHICLFTLWGQFQLYPSCFVLCCGLCFKQLHQNLKCAWHVAFLTNFVIKIKVQETWLWIKM